MPTQAAILPSTMRCGTAGRTHMRSFPSCVPRCGTEAAANSGPQLGYTEGGEGLSMRGYHPPPPSPSVPGTPGAREGAAEGVLLAAKAHLSHPFLGGNHVPVCLSLSQSVTVAVSDRRLNHRTGTALLLPLSSSHPPPSPFCTWPLHAPKTRFLCSLHGPSAANLVPERYLAPSQEATWTARPRYRYRVGVRYHNFCTVV